MTAHILHDKSACIADIHREKLEAPELTDKVLELFRKHKPRTIYIEYKSSGIGLIQYLKTENIPLPIHKIMRNAASGDRDSIVRANGVASYLKCGYVSYVEHASWSTGFLHELMAFPTGSHDDQVDCLTDLVSMEIVPNGTFMPDMDTSGLPIGETTHEVKTIEESMGTGLDFLKYLDDNGINYLGKEPTESDMPEWAIGL
jgi:predicted phage terminase large subunit-like protein